MLSGYLSGTGWWCGIVSHFAFETVCDHLTAGRDFFSVCQKWSDRGFADLVGVSDYGSDCMSGGISVFKENKKK